VSGYRFYGDLAGWWPLLSPPEEYADEAAYLARLPDTAGVPAGGELLELGSGGGHLASHLPYTLTLVDLSASMLAVSRALNPGAMHHEGDLRTVRLDRGYDAVLVHDAIDYMVTEADLGQAIGTAYHHCRPGGVALFVPDRTAETYEPSTDCGGTDGPDGRSARYLEWTRTPGETEYAFLLREADGTVRTAHETHHTGCFDRATWLRLLTGAGFAATRLTEDTDEDRVPRDVFLGHREA
jgi:SAM-dependent methyltransferase